MEERGGERQGGEGGRQSPYNSDYGSDITGLSLITRTLPYYAHVPGLAAQAVVAVVPSDTLENATDTPTVKSPPNSER